MTIRSKENNTYIVMLIVHLIFFLVGSRFMQDNLIYFWIFAYFLSFYVFFSGWFINGKNIVMDEPEVAERLREDPDSYQLRESFTDMKQEIVQTSQRKDVKIGVMGYPERACAETGAKIEAEFLANAVPAIKNAIEQAKKARISGERIVHDNGGKLKIREV